jgi:hypothetical protein
MVEFLDDCTLNHPKYLQGIFHHSILPSRLIDVGSYDGTREPQLISSTGISKIARYTTLSHYWGTRPNKMPLRTTCVTIEAYIIIMPIKILPRIFRDIINVIRILNIRYIWINLLYIIQDNPQD